MNFAVATVAAEQKPNLAMKHRHKFLFLCLFCCTCAFMIPFTTSGFFCLKDGLKCSLSSLQFFLPATWPQYIPQASGCSVLLCYYFLHLPKYLSRATPRWIYFTLYYRSLRIPFSGESNVQHFQWAHEGSRCLSRNHWRWWISPVGWGFIPLSYHYY